MIPTLFGIMLVSFSIVQFAPGGPVERIIAQLQSGGMGGGTSGLLGTGSDFSVSPGGSESAGHYKGTQGLDPAFIASLEKQFGFDKPPLERFFSMMKNYLTFNFGQSYFRDVSVIQLIREKLPVSISLGIWMTLLAYLISIPLGISKALHNGSRFDMWTSSVVIIGYAVPSFLFAILLVVLFAGGSFWQIFPLRGLTSEGWSSFSFSHKIKDYLWHIILPVLALSVGAFATLTFLVKNAFLDEINKQYVLTARMKGLNQKAVLYRHVFRNALLIVIAGFPAAFIHAFFAGSLLIESIFSLDGLGLLSFESIINRDYPVVFASLYIFSLLSLGINLLADLIYAWVDPRIDFESRS